MPESLKPSLLSLLLSFVGLAACAGDEAQLSKPVPVPGSASPAATDSDPALASASPPAAFAYLREAPETESIQQVKLNGLVFDVRVAGPRRGEVVILLHGFPETSYEWRHQIPALAAAGFRVLAPDMRGTSPGARPEEVDQYGLLNFVSDVIELANAYGAARFHLVGHDVGALVSWGTAQLHALRVITLTALSVPHPGAFARELSDPESCQSKASSWYNDIVNDPQAAEKLLAGDPPLLLDVWNSFPSDASAEYRRVLGTPAALDAVINIWRANFIDGEPQGAFPIPVITPVLYLWGQKDPYNCPEGEPLTRLLSWGGYRFVSMPEVGHFIAEQAPDQFNGLLITHLRRKE